MSVYTSSFTLEFKHLTVTPTSISSSYWYSRRYRDCPGHLKIMLKGVPIQSPSVGTSTVQHYDPQRAHALSRDQSDSSASPEPARTAPQPPEPTYAPPPTPPPPPISQAEQSADRLLSQADQLLGSADQLAANAQQQNPESPPSAGPRTLTYVSFARHPGLPGESDGTWGVGINNNSQNAADGAGWTTVMPRSPAGLHNVAPAIRVFLGGERGQHLRLRLRHSWATGPIQPVPHAVQTRRPPRRPKPCKTANLTLTSRATSSGVGRENDFQE